MMRANKAKAAALGLVFLASILLVGLPQSADAYTWYSYREDVSVNGYNATDLYENATRDYGAWAGAADENISGNFTLPAPIEDATAMTWTVYNAEATNYNLTWNGIAQLDNQSLTGSHEYGVTEDGKTESYVNWSFNASDAVEGDTYLNFSIHYEDTYIGDPWITNATYGLVKNVKERINQQTPIYVGKDYRDSWYSVVDQITVNATLLDSTNNSIEIYDADLDLNYPGHASNTPSASVAYINTSGDAQTLTVSYQKNGPYVDRLEHSKDGDTHTTTVDVKDFETNTGVSWTINTTVEQYSEYFPGLDYDTLTIEKYGTSIDWSEGSIVMDDLSLRQGFNQFTFTWTEEEEPAPPGPSPAEAEEVPLYQQKIGPVPVWGMGVFIACIAGLIGLLAVAERETS